LAVSALLQCAGCGGLFVRAALDNHRSKARKATPSSGCARTSNYLLPPEDDGDFSRAVAAGKKKVAQARALVVWRRYSPQQLAERVAAAGKRRRSIVSQSQACATVGLEEEGSVGSVGGWGETEEEEEEEGEGEEEEEEEEEGQDEKEEEVAASDRPRTPELTRGHDTGEAGSGSPPPLPDSLWEQVDGPAVAAAPASVPAVPAPGPASVASRPATAPTLAATATVTGDGVQLAVAEFIRQCADRMLAVWLEKPSAAAVRLAGRSQWPPVGDVSQWLWLPLLRYALSCKACAAWVQLEQRYPAVRLLVEAYAMDFQGRGLRKGDISEGVQRLTAEEVDLVFNPAAPRGTVPHSGGTALLRVLLGRPPSSVPVVLYQTMAAVGDEVMGEVAATAAAPPS